MESLSTLPSKNDTVKTPEEEMILQQLFAGPPSHAAAPSIPVNPNLPPPSSHPKLNWKIMGLTVALFAVLANPWIDSLLCKIPYCGGGIGITVLKTLLFFILLLCIHLFL